jgi:hypothetical protein
MVHVTHVECCLGVGVILLNYFVKQWGKSGIRVVRSSVDADARVGVLAARKDSLLERESSRIFFIFKFVPYFTSQVFA